jgi:hypothetical protein
MSAFPVGCYVMHKKLSELGSGEVVMVDRGAIRIRFASGERSFLEAYVGSHLEVTADAPVVAATTRKRAARKTPSKRKGVSPSTPPARDAATED